MIWASVAIAILCFATVAAALVLNAIEAGRHPEQHEHVPGEWL